VKQSKEEKSKKVGGDKGKIKEKPEKTWKEPPEKPQEKKERLRNFRF
jgi:hypothetical protein